VLAKYFLSGHVLHKVDLVFPANLRQIVIRHRQGFCVWLKRNGMPDCRIVEEGATTFSSLWFSRVGDYLMP
jgi:hypothetical protein